MSGYAIFDGRPADRANDCARFARLHTFFAITAKPPFTISGYRPAQRF
jgi:hypothetical protein